MADQYKRYESPVKYLKAHRAYLVTLQRPSRKRTRGMVRPVPGLYDVVRDGGDRALPLGFIWHEDKVYAAFHYAPAHSADTNHGIFIAGYTTLDEAVDTILNTPRSAGPNVSLEQLRGR